MGVQSSDKSHSPASTTAQQPRTHPCERGYRTCTKGPSRMCTAYFLFYYSLEQPLTAVSPWAQQRGIAKSKQRRAQLRERLKTPSPHNKNINIKSRGNILHCTFYVQHRPQSDTFPKWVIELNLRDQLLLEV